ncbi:MAG: ADOP family duplicated permease [Vicinamibacteria bacterium]
MRALRRLVSRLANLAGRHRTDERLTEEIEAHIAAEAEEGVRSGLTPEAALRRARLRFGTVEAVRQDVRAEAGLPFLEDLLRDVRYALRVLRASPALTLVAVCTLALGIGANVVVFGVVNAVLLHPLPVRDPGSLYQVRNQQWRSFGLLTTSYPAFEDYRRRNATFAGMAAINGYSSAALGWRNAVTRVSGQEVTGNYFELLGVEPAIGRFFAASDERGPGSAPYVVLSDALWRSAFHADRSAVGTTVMLNRQPFTVLGVAPPQFHGTERFVRPDYWIPIVNQEQLGGRDDLQSRTSASVTVIGRLRPGVTAQQAAEDLSAVSATLAREYPESDSGLPLRLVRPGLFGDNGDVIRGFLYGVTVLALLVLAAACANLASLFAARTSDRHRELALRLALGASRGRLVRQLLTEAVVVSALGGALAFVGATLLLGALGRWQVPYGQAEFAVDGRVFLAALALTLGSALVFGIVPAQQVSRSGALQTMKGAAPALRRFAVRDLLLGAQIAICTLLVTAALVAVDGLERLLQAPLGFDPRGVTLAELDWRLTERADDAPLAREKGVIDAVRDVPGVSAVGAVSRTPMSGGIRGTPVYRPGTADPTPKNQALAPYVFAMSPGYLEAAGTRLVSGRDVSWHDAPETPRVAVVNRTFARALWADAPPLGQRFLLRGRLTEVVGVLEDGKYREVTEPPQPAVYLPLAQAGPGGVVYVVRSRLTPARAAEALQRTLRELEPNAPATLNSWPDALEHALFPARSATAALGVLGVLAAMLVVTGVFGMAAYGVSRRTKELGIRVSLGARRTQVMSAALARPLALLGAGSLLGLLLGAFAGRLLQHLVHQANPRDPAVVVGAVLTMALLGLAASAIPARRALSVDPARLLRED